MIIPARIQGEVTNLAHRRCGKRERGLIVLRRNAFLACVGILLAVVPGRAHSQISARPPIIEPAPMLVFHFSDAARDAEYWRLNGEVERTMAAARDALYQARAELKQPAPRPGTAAWFHARAAVERAIRAHHPVRDAMAALIAFATREGRNVPPSEAYRALQIRHVTEESLRGTSDVLVDLLAELTGIRTR